MRNLLRAISIITFVAIATPVLALTVSPARLEISGDPGTTIQGNVEIFNEQESSKTFYTSFENFEPSGDTGAPHFIGAKDDLATWIHTDSKVILEPAKKRVVPFTIAIPQNAEPGGHYAAIFFGTQEPAAQEGGQVSIGGKIGVLILLRVNGAITEGAGLVDFNTKDKQSFFSTLPVTFTYRINNTGGDRIVPLGEIKIKNTLQMPSATLLANKDSGSVLSNSIRKFETTWGTESKDDSKQPSPGFFETVGKQWNDFHFGRYTANLNLTWGSTNQTASAAYSFFIIPWQLFLVILVILAIVGFFGRIGIKKYNRWIIAQAKNQK